VPTIASSDIWAAGVERGVGVTIDPGAEHGAATLVAVRLYTSVSPPKLMRSGAHERIVTSEPPVGKRALGHSSSWPGGARLRPSTFFSSVACSRESTMRARSDDRTRGTHESIEA
jgi:hypothetical protein